MSDTMASSSNPSLTLQKEYEAIRNQEYEPKMKASSNVNKSKAETWIPKMKKIVEFVDENGRSRIVGKYAERKPTKNFQGGKGDFSNHSVVWRNKIRQHGRHIHSDCQMEINSSSLQDLFREFAKPYKELDLQADPIVVKPPFQSIFFLRGKLGDISKDPSTPPETQQEVQEILAFFESDSTFQQLSSDYDNLIPTNRISFDLLWALYPPQEIVYHTKINPTGVATEWCGVVERTEFTDCKEGRLLQLLVVVGFHSGDKFSIVTRIMQLWEFTGIRDFFRNQANTNFPIPLSRLPKARQQEIRSRLVERGKRYIDISSRPYSFLSYSGPVRMTNKDEAKRLLFRPEHSYIKIHDWAHGERVIVDKESQLKAPGMNQLEIMSRRKRADCIQDYRDGTSFKPPKALEDILHGTSSALNWATGPKKSSEMDEDDYLICSEIVEAFRIKDKCWVDQVLVDGLTEIQWNASPYSALQLPNENKVFIRQLVSGFDTDKWNDDYGDIIKGKGRGLTFLLHGAPGLGKTLTAESIAETTRRPLYHVSTGELSSEVSRLEAQLTEVFRLGAKWGAIVLLDEADVLMTKRSSSDMQHNAIVAVFLRMLEYYEGLLFVTTNRLEDFDEAFHNRVHVTIAYHALEPAYRANIWQQHVSKIVASQKPELWTKEIYQVLGELEINGRDIRNFTRTAYGYAKTLGDLHLGHILLVVRNNFNRKKLEECKDTLEKLEKLSSAWKVEDEGEPKQ